MIPSQPGLYALAATCERTFGMIGYQFGHNCQVHPVGGPTR
jgi:hypothetical protein